MTTVTNHMARLYRLDTVNIVPETPTPVEDALLLRYNTPALRALVKDRSLELADGLTLEDLEEHATKKPAAAAETTPEGEAGGEGEGGEAAKTNAKPKPKPQAADK